MKARILLLCLLLYAPALLGQVTQMSVRDSTLLKAIDMFLDSMVSHDIHLNQFVIGAVITKLEVSRKAEHERTHSENMEYPQSEFKCSYDLVLSAQTEPMLSDRRVATCKFKYRNKEVYLFLGAEFFVKYLEGDRKKLRRSEPHGVVSGSPVLCTMLCEINWNSIGVKFFAL